MRHLLFPLLLSLSVSAQAGGSAAPLRVSGQDITAPGFSLREHLKAHSCHGDVTATPLSLTGDLLSVKVSGTLCGEPYRGVNVYSLSGKTLPTLSDLFGERAVVNALQRDPYLNAFRPVQGETVSDLTLSFAEQPPRGDCPASPSALSIAERSYAVWKTQGQQVNVHLALPVSCNGHASNDFVWLGLLLPAGNLKQTVVFDFAHRPHGTAHIRW